MTYDEKRIGSGHEEIVVGDRAVCAICGPIGPGADTEFHGDSLTQSVELDGLAVHLHRAADGKLVVDIDTTALDAKDEHGDTGVPNIRIWINEQKIEVRSDGSLEES